MDDLDAAIGGAAINNDVLERVVALLHHRAQGLFQVGSLVVRRGDDADQGQGSGFARS